MMFGLPRPNFNNKQIFKEPVKNASQFFQNNCFSIFYVLIFHISNHFLLTKYFLTFSTHMVVAPRTLRPGAVYRCVVSILHLDFPVGVRASLQRDGVEITYEEKEVIKGYPEALLLQVG